MAKAEVHPKAYLATKRNVKAGIRARSKILFVLEEAKRGIAPLTHYREIAHSLPTRPELHKSLIEKAEREELSQPEIRTVAQVRISVKSAACSG